MTVNDFVIALGAALGLGLLIGLERQWGQHPAGVRTNALVSAGAALYVLMGRVFVNDTDTARVAAQVVTGIGFLGGGVILREGLSVRGLTSAATLWCAAAIGTLCGAGKLLDATIAAAAILLTNWLFNPVSRWIDYRVAQRGSAEASYRLKVICAMSDASRIYGILSQQIGAQRAMLLRGIGIQSTDHPDRGLVAAEVEMQVRDEHLLQDLVAKLNADPSTTSTCWERHS